MAGDFIAALYPTDQRSKVSSQADIVHRKFIQDKGLKPADPLSLDETGALVPRRHTYRKNRAATPCSRIDDIFLHMGATALADLHQQTTFVDMTGVGTDHDIMTVTMSYHGLRMLPLVEAPTSNATNDRKLKTPISKSDMLALQQALRS
jgi:hypothetical protein